MKILLLHPKDSLPQSELAHSWDLIVDFARAPVSTYEAWSRQAGCRVVSLYDFAEEFDDLYRVKALLQLGMGQVVDRLGIDWWDVSALLIVDDLLRIQLLKRLAGELDSGCELHTTRPNSLARILQSFCAGQLHSLERRFQSIWRRATHYSEALANLDGGQLMQVLQDKYDPQHAIRKRLALHTPRPKGQATLLPSSYINVSRMAVAFANMLPGEQFFLVYARPSGKLPCVPPNVTMAALHPYFVRNDPAEFASLSQDWERLRLKLVSSSSEFAAANAGGTLGRITPLIRSGLAARNAWQRVYETGNISGCLCTDDTAPYTRIPLILAKNSGIPAVACHHGAFDLRMTIKQRHVDAYLAKGEMERDYLLRLSHLPADIIVDGGPARWEEGGEPFACPQTEGWLVFFSEPYQADAWRSGEVYRDLIPHLCSLAKTCGLRLVFKLHPFESAKSVRQLLRKDLPREKEREIYVLTGPISQQLWQNTKFAMTVQSTVALECYSRGIPVFLCGWLRTSFGGYIKQYTRFGVGRILDSAGQIADIPRLLKTYSMQAGSGGGRWQTIDSALLHNLLHRKHFARAEGGS